MMYNEPTTLTTNSFTVGEWQVDPVRNTLSNKLIETRLEKRLIAILAALANAPEQQLSKEELILRVWGKKAASDETLSVAISKIRKALGCNAKNPVYIRTIGGHGFKLICKTNITEKANIVQATKAQSVKAKSTSPVLAHSQSKIVRYAALIIAATLLITALIANLANHPVPFSTLSQDEQIIYHKARHLMQRETKEDLLEARKILAKLYNDYPQQAEVLGEYAKSYFFYDFLNNRAPGPNEKKIKALFKQAIQLNPKIADLHLQLALISFYYDCDFKQAEKHFLNSLKLAPENMYILFNYTELLMAMREFDKAIHYMKKLIKAHPEFYSWGHIAYISLLARDMKTAEQEVAKVHLANTSPEYRAHAALFIAEAKGDDETVFNIYLDNFKKNNYTKAEIATAVNIYKTKGIKQLNLWLAETKKEQRNVGHFTPPLSTARYYIGAGEYIKALPYLKQAVEQRSYTTMWINSDPKYKPLHDMAEFQDLVDQLGLKVQTIRN